MLLVPELVVLVSSYLVTPTSAKHLATPVDGYVTPSDPDTMLYGTGYGVWMTHDLGAADSGGTVNFEFAVDNLEETVTLDASQLSALPAKAQTVALTPQLPTRDADIETAGDRIAEAITSLSKRRGTTTARNTTAALRALDQAKAALARALHDKPHDEPVRDALRSAIRDLNAAEQTIKRSAFPDAIRDLNTLNKKLDTLHGAEDSKL